MNSKQKCFKNPDKTNKHLLYIFNPIKAGGSESFLKKALEIRYRVKMHVHSPIFQGQLFEKKIRSITFIVWVLERVEKNA